MLNVVSIARMGELETGLTILPRVGLSAVVIVTGCILFARAGLPAAMTFAAVLDARHLLRLVSSDSFLP